MAPSDSDSAPSTPAPGGFEDATEGAPSDHEMAELAKKMGNPEAKQAASNGKKKGREKAAATPTRAFMPGRGGYLGEPIQVSLEEIEIPPKEPTARYWCGCTSECPRQVIHCAGVDFPYYDGPLPHDHRGQPQDPVVFGRIHELRPSQVKEIVRRIQQKVVRWSEPTANGKVRGTLLSMFSQPGGGRLNLKPVRDDRHLPEQGDIPLGCYVYLIKLEDGFEPSRGAVPEDACLVMLAKG